jgi:hypothetical protein
MEEATAVEPSATEQLRELKAAQAAKLLEYGTFNTRHTELWQLRKQAKLERDDYVDYLMITDKMEVLLKELQALEPQIAYAEAAAAIDKGRRHHDALVPTVTEAARQVCQKFAAFVQACGAFVEVSDNQVSDLWSLPGADGQPAFDLPDGSVILQRMLQQFPHQPGDLTATVIRTMSVGMTQGDMQRALAYVTGKQPFSPTLVKRYLEGFRVDEPKPMEDV